MNSLGQLTLFVGIAILLLGLAASRPRAATRLAANKNWLSLLFLGGSTIALGISTIYLL